MSWEGKKVSKPPSRYFELHITVIIFLINPIHAQILYQPIHRGEGVKFDPPLSLVTEVIEVQTKKYLVKDLNNQSSYIF